MLTNLLVTWQPGGIERVCPPDPAYPCGTDLILCFPDQPWCWSRLPYPAPGCGAHVIDCLRCRRHVACSASGRHDDPRSIRIPCRDVPE